MIEEGFSPAAHYKILPSQSTAQVDQIGKNHPPILRFGDGRIVQHLEENTLLTGLIQDGVLQLHHLLSQVEGNNVHCLKISPRKLKVVYLLYARCINYGIFSHWRSQQQ